MDNHGLIASLFDLSFSHFITPKIQRFLYVLLLIAAGLAGLGVLATAIGMAHGFFGKTGALIVGIPLAGLAFLFLAMYFRVMMELLIVVFRGVDYLREISTSVRTNPGGARAA
jgi:uncharacterized membrane protein